MFSVSFFLFPFPLLIIHHVRLQQIIENEQISLGTVFLETNYNGPFLIKLDLRGGTLLYNLHSAYLQAT